MAFDVEGLMRLWTDPGLSGPAAVEAFRRFYTDPVTVNGTPLSAADLAARAAGIRGTFADLRRELLEVCEGEDRVAVAFRLSGRQTGRLATSAGTLEATGAALSLRVIDILTLTDGRISSIWMVADELGALAAHDLVRLGPA
ncbi:ester cyclase [Georgenia sp. SYP-B2076]|uniref:ester cyclase n=1 Tax=Georgenia sp. SYP-B2076 TaxID=2495881 RepID=UPI000F8CECAC|nr:ester cyclase [Georgenia sp. SYP-B2076]